MNKNKLSLGKRLGIAALVIVIGVIAGVLIASGLNKTPAEEPAPAKVPVIDYDELFQAYQANELRADDTYKGNRYRVSGIIEGMTDDGLLNTGITVTVTVKTSSASYTTYAEFSEDQHDGLAALNTGDTIAFEGDCSSIGLWSNCELE